MQAFVLLVSAPSLHNRGFLLGNAPHSCASFFYCAYPENRTSRFLHPVNQFSNFPFGLTCLSLDQVLDRLVSPSSMRCRTSTGDLSPGSLPGVLLLSNGTLLLEVGFTLRCLQRLSRPYLATQPCHWRDNRCTRGASIPVLSY